MKQFIDDVLDISYKYFFLIMSPVLIGAVVWFYLMGTI